MFVLPTFVFHGIFNGVAITLLVYQWSSLHAICSKFITIYTAILFGLSKNYVKIYLECSFRKVLKYFVHQFGRGENDGPGC